MLAGTQKVDRESIAHMQVGGKGGLVRGVCVHLFFRAVFYWTFTVLGKKCFAAVVFERFQVQRCGSWSPRCCCWVFQVCNRFLLILGCVERLANKLFSSRTTKEKATRQSSPAGPCLHTRLPSSFCLFFHHVLYMHTGM